MWHRLSPPYGHETPNRPSPASPTAHCDDCWGVQGNRNKETREEVEETGLLDDGRDGDRGCAPGRQQKRPSSPALVRAISHVTIDPNAPARLHVNVPKRHCLHFFSGGQQVECDLERPALCAANVLQELLLLINIRRTQPWESTISREGAHEMPANRRPYPDQPWLNWTDSTDSDGYRRTNRWRRVP